MPGKISLDIHNAKNEIIIIIKDNGVGRDAAKSLTSHPGKDLLIPDNYLTIYKKSQGTAISYNLEDCEPESENPGTKVTISISNRRL